MKTALITGVAGNLGAAVAKKFVAEGYRVVGVVNKVAAETDNSIETLQADLTDEAAVTQLTNEIIAKYKTVDVLAATAGGFAMGDIATTTAADIAFQHKLNFETAYNIARPIFIHMCQRNSGRIFFTGSRPGLDAANTKGMVAYSLSKSLLVHLSELMNGEAKGLDVVTSLIVPSTIDTPQNRQAMPNADFTKWVSPESIANVMYFYCTEAASVIRQPVIKVYNKA